jgi:hypothetical protein
MDEAPGEALGELLRTVMRWAMVWLRSGCGLADGGGRTGHNRLETAGPRPSSLTLLRLSHIPTGMAPRCSPLSMPGAHAMPRPCLARATQPLPVNLPYSTSRRSRIQPFTWEASTRT